MATKFGTASGIPERRVRPIWDAVDSRQFKAALKLSTALLAKYPNSPYAVALKGLILERMGKPDEALSVCLNAKELLYSDDLTQIDDLTLTTLQIVFHRLDRLDLATSCYEYACGKFPNNLDLIMGLFNCYVREYSFAKQQQTAIKMYKVVGEERFLLWAVCSIQLQVLCGEGGDKLLHLAEALLKKHITSHSLHEPEALLVYLSILEQQAKYGAALEVLSGQLGSLVVLQGEKLRIQGRLLARARDYAAAADVFQKILKMSPDDWVAFIHYLDCLLEDDSRWCLGDMNDIGHSPKDFDFKACKLTHLTDEMFESRISIALNFVQKLLSEANNEHLRGPYLARLEIERRCRLHGKALDDKLVEFLLQYFYKFGHLACFTSDVEAFLQVSTHEERMQLLREASKTCRSPFPSTFKALGQAITSFKIQEKVGAFARVPVCELEGVATQMTEIYLKNLHLSNNLDPQENMHGEELLTMACSVLVQLFWRTRHLGYLLEAVIVLEFGLNIRRYIWPYKIYLLHLYSFLEALPSAFEWYRTLEIKNILLETASHHILPQMLKSTLWHDLTDLLNEYLRFMDDHFREAADLTFLAYRHRNYTKVIDFVQFRKRLENSHQYLLARIEVPILQLKQKVDHLEEIEAIFENLRYGIQLLELSSEEHLKSITFNEDMQSRPWWSPTPEENYLLGSFDGDKFYLGENSGKQQTTLKEVDRRKEIKRRSLIPRLIYLAIQTASPHRENVAINGSAHDDKISTDMKVLLEEFVGTIGLSFSDAVDIIVGISEGHKSIKEHGLEVVELMNFAVFLNAMSFSHSLGVVNKDGCSINSWCLVNNLLEKWVNEQLESMQPILTCPGGNLQTLIQIVTEPLSWHILVIQSFARSLLPAAGKKKKRSSHTDQSNFPLSNAIQTSVQSLCRTIEQVLEWLDGQLNTTEDIKLDILLSLLQRNGSDMGPGKVFHIIENATSTANSDVGERISQAFERWNSTDVIRGIIRSQSIVLSKFHQACNSRLNSMTSTLKQLV